MAKIKEKAKIYNPLDKLYPYQKDAVNSTFYNNKGIVCLPTGTGKTFIQAAIIANDIMLNMGQFRFYVVNAPRILLTFQLLKEVYSFLMEAGIESRYMFVHSGGTSDEKELEEIRIRCSTDDKVIPYSQITSGTSPQSIKDMMKKSREQNLPLIFFSTYNSADRIETAKDELEDELKRPVPVSIVLNDEAHYLVQERFHDILHTLTTPRCYFFTATTIHTPSDKGRGMNNEDLYGKVLYQMVPLQAILLGKMVRPRLHIVSTDGVYTTDDYNKSLNKIIADTFLQHKNVLKKTKQTAKMLISTKGTQDIKNFLLSKEYDELLSNGVSIYVIASNEEIGNNINRTNVNRSHFLKQLRIDGEDSSKEMIVLHYDILAEGIDVSGFTGIMPLRTLSKSKFLQTYGRAARPDRQDRKRIDAGEINPGDPTQLKLYRKPYSYVIIPNIIHSNEDDKENMIQLIEELRTFGFKPSEDIIASAIVNGIPEEEEISGLNTLQRRLPNIGVLINNLKAELEAEAEARLSAVELLSKKFL